MSYSKASLYMLALSCVLLCSPLTSTAQTSPFSYQGRLQDGATPANGNYDFQFTLWDALSGGTQQPQPTPVTLTKIAVTVANGLFTVQLDFGANAFPGPDRFLETSVRPAGGVAFTLLTPRQPITSTPYAIRSASSASADTATNSTQLGGIASSQFVLTSDSRLTDARTPTPGSSNYIQNATAVQANSNFNISGNGIAGGFLSGNTVDTKNSYSINGTTVLKGFGDNIFVGRNAGLANTTGVSNSFFGVFAGQANTTGFDNTFVGYIAGISNATGNNNSFFGALAGSANTASGNSFFGYAAGNQNTTGGSNSFFGLQAGLQNKTGSNNAFFGVNAGAASLSDNNSFFGEDAGVKTSSGQNNSFFGNISGFTNTTGSYNTLLGYFSDVSSPTLTNATAIGANSIVAQSNSLVLGSIFNATTGATDTNVGIGTTTPLARLDVRGNSAVSGNLGIGTTAPAVRLDIRSGFDGQTGPVEAIRIGGPNSPADANSAQDLRWSFASAGSATVRSYRGNSWDTYLQFLTNAAAQGGDSPQVRMHIDQSGNVGIGTTAPSSKLHVNGVIRMDALGSQAGIFPLCWNASDQIASCTSSSLRYKTRVQSFTGGLEIISRLRPISFTWRDGGMHDLGLAAEEVEKVEPLLAYRNKKGEVEGVRYNQLSAVFINAFKEQQAQIQRLQQQVKEQNKQAEQQQAAFAVQQLQLDQLKKLVCSSRRPAKACR